MSSDLMLAIVNLIQVVALAWIGYRQAMVQVELKRVNGRVQESLDAIARAQQPNASA